ncbi:MAG: LysE family transporter [Verrucomicrobia bacterium]|nr:LysE family transporter [Verrucomicrobiota bacterium]
MSDLHSIDTARVGEFAAILPAWLIGLLSGFFISIPVGPINVTIMNEGARRGFNYALFIGLGSALMELLYCLLGFAGFSSLFNTRIARATLELISFLMMLFLGLKYIIIAALPATTKTVEKVEHRLHPHHAFTIGFVRTLGNPGVLLFWIAVSATFISHEWVENNWADKWECIAGVAAGCVAWFALLAFAVSRGHGRFSTRTLTWMSHVSGATLLLAALVIGFRLVKLLAHR